VTFSLSLLAKTPRYAVAVLVLFLCQVGYGGQPLGEGIHFTVLHSAWYPSGSAAVIHVVCVHVDANKDIESQQDNVPLFTTKLEWLTFYSTGCLLQFNTLLIRDRPKVEVLL